MDVDAIAVAGIWWRQIPGGGAVDYWPPDPADSRWQRGAVIEALYFADTEDTAWAEWYRYLAEARIPPMVGLPRDLWRWRIDIAELADFSDERRLERVDLPVLQPGHWQWPAFQAVGEQLIQDGWQGLVAPSAARPAGRVLCLFREETTIPGTEPLPPPTLSESPPLVPTGMTT